MASRTHVWLMFFISVSWISSTQAEALWDKIQASPYNISIFIELVKTTGKSSFINAASTTVFIPDNGAFNKQFPNGIASLTAIEKEHLILFHIGQLQTMSETSIIGTTSNFDSSQVLKKGTDIGFGQYVRIISKQNSLKLYWLKSSASGSASPIYHINNAQFVAGSFDQTTSDSKGVYHVINEVIYPITKATSIKQEINSNNSFSDFRDFLSRLTTSGTVAANAFNTLISGADSNIGTFFIPVNSAFQGIPDTVRNDIKNNQTKLLQFLASHVAPNQLVFVSWMKNHSKIEPKMGINEHPAYDIKSTVYYNNKTNKNFVSAGGVVAEAIDTTKPFKNGVLFTINKPLNLLWQTVANILQTKAPDFYALCDSIPECKSFMTNGNCTFFAPKSIGNLNKLSADLRKAYILLHIVQNPQVSLATMSNPAVMIHSVNNSGTLRFTQTATTTTAYGRLNMSVGNHYYDGFVGAVIDEGDLSGKNGMVQVLATPMGYPQQTITQLLDSKRTNFSLLIEKLQSAGINFDQMTQGKSGGENRRFTFLAPTAVAFKHMETDTGRKIMNDNTLLKKLLLRLIIPNTVVLTNRSVNDELQCETMLRYDNDANDGPRTIIKMRESREKELDGTVANVIQAWINIGETNVDSQLLPYKSEWGATNGIVYALDKIPFGSTSVGRVCKSGVFCGALGNRANLSWILLLLIVGAGHRMLDWLVL